MNIIDSSDGLEFYVDSIILCTARLHDATLWTQDEHFATIPGVRYFAKGG